MHFSFQCSECGQEYELSPQMNCCPVCSKTQREDEPLKGVLEVKLSGAAPKNFNIYDLLPVKEQYFPPLPWGNTPLWKPERLRTKLKLPNLFIKDDGSNPTGSFKDRASALVSAYAASCGIDKIVLASTGNAGSSMCGMGAATGQEIILFLPETAPPAKMIQALQYGATVYKVKGNYDMAYDLSLEYSEKEGGMNRNTAWNPMTMEGKKTVSLEIFKDLGNRVPDKVIVPTGDGCILGGVYKGFKDLMELGITDSMPKIIAVQAQGSDALYRAWKTGQFEARNSSTIADSISVDIPRNGYTALRYLKQFEGEVIVVSDQQIIEAQAELSRDSGLFTEPAGAAAWAGLKQYRNQIPERETVVVLATGNGLKDTATAMKGIQMPEQTITSIKDIRG